jgi:hypothetical protein
MVRRSCVCLVLSVLAVSCTEDEAVEPGPACAEVAPQALQACVVSLNSAHRACYAANGEACGSGDPAVAAALATLESSARASCADGAFESLSQDGVVARWRYACESETSSLAWRTFGGPHGAALEQAAESTSACLLAAHGAGARLVEELLASAHTCLATDDCGRADVDPGGARSAQALAEVEAACPGRTLERTIALNPTQYVERTRQQVECLAASAHGRSPRFPLGCGPSNAEDEALVRGEYVRVVLDSATWGTHCGDGSPYSFHIRLAPAGHPLDRVVVGLQGGGVCFFDNDCSARFEAVPGLFTAADDEPPTAAIMSNDPDENPFAHWTKVFLPYCTQDVFIGGGVIESFDALDLHRFGALNVRAALRATRDLLWRHMDAEGGAGYRAGDVVALFGGWSAGSYGTLYNYHWVLDDLLWQRTAAFPDAGLGLDNGQNVGVRTFGGILLGSWQALQFLPPYCFSGDCAVGPDNLAAIAPRLRQVPEQQILVFSNQKDVIQQRDAFFGENEALFINTMRRAYCDTKDLDGIHWYLTSVSDQSVHVVTLQPELYRGEVAGLSMRDWLAGAIDAPDTVVDRAENGDFGTVVPGVEPFPCPLP